ncbi:MAG: MerR family transcriptional regulator [Defluviitaleaceae bacterium]|nr:MerR family transcriptional regulator [Defluviitaleaceae bacterium]MCL2836224.1 MerR family transcriptional regulator [Defluviitaleaceae bacterium]
MQNLIKIKDVSNKYDITARTLRYYEDMGLISSTRSDDYAYRMYDENAIRKLEQILILRKLNISIKDIQRIFNTSGSEVVIGVLEKKVQNIDDEVALLHELKGIVTEFIREIERVNFADNSDIKLLYDKAKEIETQFVNVDYIGKPSNINRLMEITEKLDKKIPDVIIVRIPEFRAVTSGCGKWDEWGKLMDWAWQEGRHNYFRDVIFDCADFLIRKEGMFEYIMAVKDNITAAETSPFEIIEFTGGLYALAMSINDDDESIHKVEDKICKWLKTTNFEYDESRGIMGQMPYLNESEDDEIKKGLGYFQLARYVPIRLKDGNNLC